MPNPINNSRFRDFAVILIACAMIPIFAIAGELDARTAAIVQTTISGSAELSSGTQELIATIHYLPITREHQTVTTHRVMSIPVAWQGGKRGVIDLNWIKPPNHVEFTISDRIEIEPIWKGFKETDRFPLQRDIGEQVARYLQPTKMIDSSDPAVKKTATQITSGSQSTQEAAWRLAQWIRDNVAYNISTLTKDVSQKASWTLLQRRGVCDELSVLLIAMARAAGIPARFVNGIVHSESGAYETDWGSHAWAEIWTPSTGWIPFDVTYAQFGWLDASHIKIGDYLDIDESSIDYRWTGPESAVFSPPTITGVIINTPLLERPELELSMITAQEPAGPGSAVIAAVRIKNPTDAWVPVTVSLAKAPGYLGHDLKPALLPPHGTRIAPFVVIIPETADEWTYVTTIEIRISTGQRVNSTLEFSRSDPVMMPEDALSELKTMEEEERLDDIPDLETRCRPSRRRYNLLESALIRCTHTNRGIETIQATACHRDDCRNVRIEPGQIAETAYSLIATASHTAQITTISGSKASGIRQKISLAPIQVSFTPVFTVSEIKCPSSVRYDESANIEITLNSTQPMQAVRYRIEGIGGFEHPDFSGEAKINVEIPGSSITGRNKDIIVYATASLPEGRRVEDFDKCPLTVTDVPIWARAWGTIVSALGVGTIDIGASVV